MFYHLVRVLCDVFCMPFILADHTIKQVQYVFDSDVL